MFSSNIQTFPFREKLKRLKTFTLTAFSVKIPKPN